MCYTGNFDKSQPCHNNYQNGQNLPQGGIDLLLGQVPGRAQNDERVDLVKVFPLNGVPEKLTVSLIRG